MRPKIDISAVRQLYLEGNSTRTVAKIMNLSYSYVHKLCKGITRSRSEALQIISTKPFTSTHWRTCRGRARKVWRAKNGDIPKGYHIHHKDGDFTNNTIENLVCISASEHSKLHWSQGDISIPVRLANPIPRHMRPARKLYMQQYFKEIVMETAICYECGKEYSRNRYGKVVTCSRTCTSKRWRRQELVINNET